MLRLREAPVYAYISTCHKPHQRENMAAAPTRVFSLEGKGLKLDTAEDLEAHIAELRAMGNVEEVRLLGNTLGIGACKLLGEVLATKKSLQVRRPSSHPRHRPLIPDD